MVLSLNEGLFVPAVGGLPSGDKLLTIVGIGDELLLSEDGVFLEGEPVLPVMDLLEPPFISLSNPGDSNDPLVDATCFLFVFLSEVDAFTCLIRLGDWSEPFLSFGPDFETLLFSLLLLRLISSDSFATDLVCRALLFFCVDDECSDSVMVDPDCCVCSKLVLDC